MNTFDELLELPGAAPVLAAKLSGRIIGRIADGFEDDPALYDMMSLFNTIDYKWPEQTMSLRAMFELHLKDASKESADNEDSLEALTPEQRAMWEKETTKLSKHDKLRKALPMIIDLQAAASPTTESWDELTPINQWSLLNATEKEVHSRLVRYTQWAEEDEAKGKTESNAITLRDDTQEAVDPLGILITKFLADPDIADALKQDLESGIRVPVRTIAA